MLRTTWNIVLAAVLVATLVTVQAACLVSPDVANCSSARGCAACLGLSGCGWCGRSHQCVAGTSIGPDQPCAAGTDWHWNDCSPAHDSAGCWMRTSCTSCASIGCAWCPGLGICSADTEADGCNSVWTASASSCAQEQECNQIPVCGLCAAGSTVCRWCDVQGGVCTGLPCSFPRATTTPSFCPSPNNCSDHSSCSTCLTETGCAWCNAVRGCYAFDDVLHGSALCDSGWVSGNQTCP